MMNYPETLYEIAYEAAHWFERKERDDGTPYVTLKDGRPEWLYEAVRAAHGDMLPDDWRYGTISEALMFIGDTEPDDIEDGHEFADQRASVYTSELCEWVASHSARLGYCEQAREDGLVAVDASISQRLMVGQYVEALEVWASLVESLQARADEIAE